MITHWLDMLYGKVPPCCEESEPGLVLPLEVTPTAPVSRHPRCECGNPLASNVREERISGCCDSCIAANPDEAYARYLDALEAYDETQENYR